MRRGEVIRNEKNKPIALFVFRSKYVAAVYEFSEDRTYFTFESGNDDLTRKQVKRAIRDMKQALKVAP